MSTTSCGTFVYKLRFYIHPNAPQKYHDEWKNFMKECSYRVKLPHHLLQSWIKKLKNCNAYALDLHILDRVESGIGGNDNYVCRQIRPIIHANDQILVLNARPSRDLKTSLWTNEELLTYGSIFQEILSEHVFSDKDSVLFDLVVGLKLTM